MTKEEKEQHIKDVGERLLQHRYRYYILDQPVLEDWVYDHLERYYEMIAKDVGIEATASNMVDFDLKRQDAQDAKTRVDNDQDYHSKWELEMKPVWEKLGKSRKQREDDKKNGSTRDLQSETKEESKT